MVHALVYHALICSQIRSMHAAPSEGGKAPFPKAAHKPGLHEHCSYVFSVGMLCITILLRVIPNGVEAHNLGSIAKCIELIEHILAAFVIMQGL